jgi:uncharacterized protein YfkK (UPF0435 family)
MSDILSDVFGEDIKEAAERIKPFHTIINKDKEEVHKWLISVKNALLEEQEKRTKQQRMHLAKYRGAVEAPRDSRDHNGRRFSKVQKFVVNQIHDLTETKVSQMMRIKPAVEVLPTNDEWEDRSSAKVVGMLLKHLWNINEVDYFVRNQHRYARIFGENFLFVLWDKDKGDLHPSFVEARDAGLKEIVNADGSVIKIDVDNPIMTGDVCYELEVPWRVLLQRQQRYEDVEYCIRITTKPTEDLKEKYPEIKEKLKSEENLSVFDVENITSKYLEEHTIVYEFFHKKSGKVGTGAHIMFTNDLILEMNEHPFTHGQLPFIRLTDLDVPEIMNGVSKYEQILPLQNMIDNLSTLIAKNIYLTAHAKWAMPRGAAKIEQLGNDNTIIQYQGPVPPQLIQVQPNAPEVYAFRQQIKEEMQVIYGSQGIARGEIPNGITAASALQFLNEMENQRAHTDIAKHSDMVKSLAKMTIAVVSDKYDVEDGRIIRVIGENNKFLLRHFDAANLHKNYDVRYDLSSGLPESKSGKLQRIMDTMQRNPTLFSPERWEELLDLGNSEKMQTLATAAVKSADSETDDLMNGDPVAPPEEWEDHIAHWEAHSRAIQSRSLKEEAPPEIIDALRDHIYIHEEAMLLKAQSNPLFQSQLASLKLFPLFYHQGSAVPLSKEQQEAVVNGQANRGEEITGSIPGQDSEQQKNNLQD